MKKFCQSSRVKSHFPLMFEMFDTPDLMTRLLKTALGSDHDLEVDMP